MRILPQTYEVRPVSELKEHPENPRKGKVEVISESIETNGFYGSVLVQKSTGLIIAGNHRYRTAVAQGATELPVTVLDVDDATARRIMLIDNRSNDGAGYDEAKLAKLLEEAKATEQGMAGTGYSPTDLDHMLLSLARDAEVAAENAGPEVHLGGKAVVSYTLVFDDAGQQEDFFKLLRWLEKTYPALETKTARISEFLREYVPGLNL